MEGPVPGHRAGARTQDYIPALRCRGLGLCAGEGESVQASQGSG